MIKKRREYNNLSHDRMYLGTKNYVPYKLFLEYAINLCENMVFQDRKFENKDGCWDC